MNVHAPYITGKKCVVPVILGFLGGAFLVDLLLSPHSHTDTHGHTRTHTDTHGHTWTHTDTHFFFTKANLMKKGKREKERGQAMFS